MSSDIAVKVTNLSKCYQIYDKPRDRVMQIIAGKKKQYYREFWALKDVSFEIKKGETVGIIGRNGSGKSTLLQLLCGTLSPNAGQIETHGRIAALLELGSGFNPEFTGRENVYMNAAILGLNKHEIRERFDKIVAFADIGDFIERPVKTYSSGMMLRLAFSVIVHVDADILVIDEALAVGDVFFTQKCMRFLRDFMKKGTVFFVSHDTASVKSLCNRAIWLDKGKILQDGSPKTVCELYHEAYYEALQGKSQTHKFKKLENESFTTNAAKDMRMKFINNSNLRNDLQIFKFNLNSTSFGTGNAQICDVLLLDENESPLSWLIGGEKVALRVIAKTYIDLDAPIIGFFVKDRTGQCLFGDNTFLTYYRNNITCASDSYIQADFTFEMPLLPIGDYSIMVSIANGTQEFHEQHHWVDDAILFKSESSLVASGLIGIPMHNIKLQSFTQAIA